MLISFPPGTEMVQFPGYCSVHLWIQCTVTGLSSSRVTPFGDPRIKGCLLLPVAFRSLPRPSSPDSSEASTMNSCSLDHILSLPLIVFSGSQSVRRSALAAHPRLSAIITVSHSQARRTRRFCRAKRPRFTRAEGPCLLRHKASSLCAGTLALCTGASDRIATSCGRNPSFGSSLFGSPRSRCKHDTSPASSRKPSQLSLRLRTLPFPGLSKIITACAAACPLSTSYPSVRRSPTAVQPFNSM